MRQQGWKDIICGDRNWASVKASAGGPIRSHRVNAGQRQGTIMGPMSSSVLVAQRPRRTLMLAVLTALALLVVTGQARAQQAELVFGPFFDPVSKSYFELRDFSYIKGTGKYWENINTHAKRLTYKGVRARLAIVRTAETHRFVEQNILSKVKGEGDGGAIWIGLRVYCRGMKLFWVDGHVRRRGEFVTWQRKWSRYGQERCAGGETFMPVYYTRKAGRWAWQAVGPAKNFRHALVEYPTGEE